LFSCQIFFCRSNFTKKKIWSFYLRFPIANLSIPESLKKLWFYIQNAKISDSLILISDITECIQESNDQHIERELYSTRTLSSYPITRTDCWLLSTRSTIHSLLSSRENTSLLAKSAQRGEGEGKVSMLRILRMLPIADRIVHVAKPGLQMQPYTYPGRTIWQARILGWMANCAGIYYNARTERVAFCEAGLKRAAWRAYQQV